MNLTGKLILSNLLVIAVGLLVLGLSTAFIAPVTFSQHMQNMQMNTTPMRGMMGQADTLDLTAAFRQSLNSALLAAGIAATAVGIGLSWYISRRIVRPIHNVVKASQRIADGHYDERLTANQRDEFGDLTRSFNRMAGALADTETMRRQLIADVSHELKTPLASIKGYMEGLQDGIIPATAETFQLVHHEADRLQRLVSDLQELSRAEASRMPLDMRACNLIEVVGSAVASLRPQAEDKHIKLSAELPASLPVVQADPDRMRQVVVNLLGNAIQYTPGGGQVSIRLWQEGMSIHCAIEDTGVGLDKGDLERIFVRFYRVDKSRSRASGGSGIGLTIARYIIEAHHGHIWAESGGLNTGSTFHFRLPVA